ncbi:MAG: EAL domain-containing protein [Eubacteriales bacterium]
MGEKDIEIKNYSAIIGHLGDWLWDSLNLDETGFDANSVMKSLGEFCRCDRTYVFEIDYVNETFSNTYEWCADGVIPQKDLLQKEALYQINAWLDIFHQNKNVIIPNVEDIRFDCPEIYAVLKPQDIHSLISVPIYLKNKLVGFLGIDNPKILEETQIAPVLKKIGALFTFIIEHKKLKEKVKYNQFHDQLTRSLNKAALDAEFSNSENWKQLGIVSCDLSELATTNQEFGLNEGDMLICRCNEFLKEIFTSYEIYRISGDRFVALCPNIDSAFFDELVLNLERKINANNYQLVCGSAWSNDLPLNPVAVLEDAEKVLHKNKAIYFSKPDPKSGKLRNRRNNQFTSFVDGLADSHTSVLCRFIENNYFNFDIFFKSMGMGENCPYFGDMQKDIWYLSDNIKEEWGFENNVTHNFLKKWANFIPYKEDLALYENDLKEIFKFKKHIHDLIYRVVDKNGEEIWIRFFGFIKWDDKNENPLFFSGHIVKLNDAFDSDPITNFKREKLAIRDMTTLLYKKEKAFSLCFRLNGFGQINEIRGRDTGNNLLKDISRTLLKGFDSEIQFYRLDGLRFLVIVFNDCGCELAEISSKIKNIVADLYTQYNLPIRYPCSVGILGEISSAMLPVELMADVSSVLEIAKTKPEADVIYSSQTLTVHREQRHMGLEIGKDVVNGMNNFRVVMQPIVSAQTHKIVGGELLLRWKYLEQNVSPMVFIPILEENDLMPVVGKWIFQQAVKLCKRINTHDPDFYLDFNVSYYQIKDETMLPYMQKILNEYELAGNRLVMELTETHYNDDPIKLQEFIESCKSMDIHIALDDFGVGYSSLEMLLKYPAHIVKLDRSLMKKMSDSSDSNVFISTIVSACHNFNKLVCVEGVETPQELEVVTLAGCDTVQGFYFYKPMEISEVYSLFVNEN